MEWFTDADYWLGRLLFQRGLAVLCLVAFLSVASQFRGLIGEHGLLPAPRFLASAALDGRRVGPHTSGRLRSACHETL